MDFQASILNEPHVLDTGAASLVRRPRGLSLLVRSIEYPPNALAQRMAKECLRLLPAGGRLLVIGGGTIGSGMDELYASDRIEIVGTDIYASPNVAAVADGHQLPFVDGCFDGVWIQAVLEHVLNPNDVVAEIHRVLKPDGLVFADTPFMQQVHEAAYDFTRYTVSGHRWLFRKFSCLEAGATGGAGSAVIRSIKYFFRAITGSRKIGRLATWPLLWLGFLDGKNQLHQDAATGVYFFGRRSDTAISPADIVRFYEVDQASV